MENFMFSTTGGKLGFSSRWGRDEDSFSSTVSDVPDSQSWRVPFREDYYVK